MQLKYTFETKQERMTVSYYLTHQKQGRQEETHNPTHKFRRLFFDLLLMGWGGCASVLRVIKQTLILLF